MRVRSFTGQAFTGQAYAGQAYAVQPHRGVLIAALVLVMVALVATDAVGCPNCKDAVNTSDPDGLNLARGYFYSILLMLAMPFTLAGSFGCYVWREMRRQQREQARLGNDLGSNTTPLGSTTAPFGSLTSDGMSRE
jgi:hypothetical protein